MDAIQETRNPMNTIERYTLSIKSRYHSPTWRHVSPNMAPLPVHATIFKEETHPSLPTSRWSWNANISTGVRHAFPVPFLNIRCHGIKVKTVNYRECLDVIDPAGGSELIGVEDERRQHPRHSHLMFWMTSFTQNPRITSNISSNRLQHLSEWKVGWDSRQASKIASTFHIKIFVSWF